MNRAKSTSVSEEKPRARGLRIDPSDLLLEIVSIVIAVSLALAAGQAVESIRAHARTHEALTEIRQEIAHDDRDLRERHALHVRVKTAFEKTVAHAANRHLDFTAMQQTFGGAAPQGFRPFGGTTTAWDLARGTDVLADVPYSVRSALQNRYAEVQNLDALNVSMIGRLEGQTTDEHPNYYYIADVLRLILTDIDYSEQNLIHDDQAALDALAKDGITS